MSSIANVALWQDVGSNHVYISGSVYTSEYGNNTTYKFARYNIDTKIVNIVNLEEWPKDMIYIGRAYGTEYWKIFIRLYNLTWDLRPKIGKGGKRKPIKDNISIPVVIEKGQYIRLNRLVVDEEVCRMSYCNRDCSRVVYICSNGDRCPICSARPPVTITPKLDCKVCGMPMKYTDGIYSCVCGMRAGIVWGDE